MNTIKELKELIKDKEAALYHLKRQLEREEKKVADLTQRIKEIGNENIPISWVK